MFRQKRFFLMWPLLLASGVMLTRPAAAQEPQTFHACYVPDVGAVYLIKITGLPTNCLSESHVEISWTEGGTGEVADGSITTVKLADAAVTTVKLADGAVATGKLAVNAVASEQVLDNSMTASDLAANSVGASEIALPVPSPARRSSTTA